MFVRRFRQPPEQQPSSGPQARPQEPQLAASLLVLMHVPLQHDWPAPHAGPEPQPHTPALQVSPGPHGGSQGTAPQPPSVHTSPAGQATPQPPQFAGSVWVSWQPSEQQTSPAVHAAPPAHWQVEVPTSHTSPAAQAGSQGRSSQEPAMHPWPAGHTTPQPPQFASSFMVSAHPSGQQVEPSSHCGRSLHRHWLLVQRLARPSQTRPQAPQLFGSPGREAQVPSQQLSPIGHIESGPQPAAGMHIPSRHSCPSGQVIGQPPASPPMSSEPGPRSRSRSSPPAPCAQPARRPARRQPIRAQRMRAGSDKAVDLHKGVRQRGRSGPEIMHQTHSVETLRGVRPFPSDIPIVGCRAERPVTRRQRATEPYEHYPVRVVPPM